MEYRIKTIWDPEAAVWTATSDDVPGLCLESGTLDALIEKVKYAVPELLAMNTKTSAGTDIAVSFAAQRKEVVAL